MEARGLVRSRMPEGACVGRHAPTTGMTAPFRCTSGTHSEGNDNYSLLPLLQVPAAALLLAVVALLAVPAAASARMPKQQLSELWGIYGEKWSPRGPTMDFSFAGEWSVWSGLGCTSSWRQTWVAASSQPPRRPICALCCRLPAGQRAPAGAPCHRIGGTFPGEGYERHKDAAGRAQVGARAACYGR